MQKVTDETLVVDLLKTQPVLSGELNLDKNKEEEKDTKQKVVNIQKFSELLDEEIIKLQEQGRTR